MLEFAVGVLVGAVVAALILAVARRRRGTDLIGAHLAGLDATPNPPAPPDAAALEREITVLLRQGKKLHAIKLLRDHVRMGLAGAKLAVERVEAGGPLRLPGGPPGHELIDPNLAKRVRDLKNSGRAIDAIKMLRQHTGMGLLEARRVLDRI